MNQNMFAKQEFSTNEMQLLQSEMMKRQKGSTAAWIFWFFLGTLGVHRFILGETKTGLIMLGAWLAGWFTVWLGIGFFILFALGVWWIIDAFNLSKMVDKRNESIETEIVNEILQLRQAGKNDVATVNE